MTFKRNAKHIGLDSPGGVPGLVVLCCRQKRVTLWSDQYCVAMDENKYYAVRRYFPRGLGPEELWKMDHRIHLATSSDSKVTPGLLLLLLSARTLKTDRWILLRTMSAGESRSRPFRSIGMSRLILFRRLGFMAASITLNGLNLVIVSPFTPS